MSTSVDGVDSQIVESKTIRWFLLGCVVHAVLLGYIHAAHYLCMCQSVCTRVDTRTTGFRSDGQK